MLARAASLGPLVAKKGRKGIPPEGKPELAALPRDHARDRGGHLGAQGHFPAAPVGEGVGLLAYHLFVLYALRFVELGGLENGGTILDVPHFLDERAAGVEEVVEKGLLLRIEVAHAPVRF